jgi:hypothetical protein
VAHDLYILLEGESMEELEGRERAEHFGLPLGALSMLQERVPGMNVPGLGHLDGSSVPPDEARAIASQLKSILKRHREDVDTELRSLFHELADFCERASAQGGFVVW